MAERLRDGFKSSQGAKRPVYLEDSAKGGRDVTNMNKLMERPLHQPIMKVTAQKHSRQGLSTAAPKVNFQTSLSPDFLNLFAN